MLLLPIGAELRRIFCFSTNQAKVQILDYGETTGKVNVSGVLSPHLPNKREEVPPERRLSWTEIKEFMVKLIWQPNLPVGSYDTFKMPPEGWIFGAQRVKNRTPPPETPKLKVREVSQSGFWNTSSNPTSLPSYSQIGWPQLLGPGTLSQTVALKTYLLCNMCYLQVIQFCKFWFLLLSKLLSSL